MRRSKTLAKLRADQCVRICTLGHYIPAYVRHAAYYGYDCIWLDLEHRYIDACAVQTLLALSHRYDIDCMVRAPILERTGLYRYLEDGAAGLMIPHVETVEQATKLVGAVKFPPLGNRSLDGAGIDGDYLHQGGDKYPEEANRETFLVVQIESPEAIANAEAIAAVPGVDGLFVGPGDLGLRLKHVSEGLTMEECLRRVGQAAAKHDKAWGCPARNASHLRELHSQGAQLVAHGNEFMSVMQMLERCGGDFD